MAIVGMSQQSIIDCAAEGGACDSREFTVFCMLTSERGHMGFFLFRVVNSESCLLIIFLYVFFNYLTFSS